MEKTNDEATAKEEADGEEGKASEK